MRDKASSYKLVETTFTCLAIGGYFLQDSAESGALHAVGVAVMAIFALLSFLIAIVLIAFWRDSDRA